MIKTIESFLKIFSYEELATRVIPLLLSISVSGQFTKGQFADVITLIRKLLDTIDTTRSKELHDIAVTSNEKPEDAAPSTKAKEQKPEMDKSERDMFDFLNQLGSGQPSGSSTTSAPAPSATTVPTISPAAGGLRTMEGSMKTGPESKGQKNDEWDLVFNIGKDQSPPSKLDDFVPERKPEVKKVEESVRTPAKAIPPPPKIASGPMKLTTKANNEGFGTINFLDLGKGPTLEDIDWGTSAPSAVATAPSITSNNAKFVNTGPVITKGGMALLNDDPFAELEAGRTGAKPNEWKMHPVQPAPIPAQSTHLPQAYNPFVAGAKKEIKKQTAANDIDDFFSELSSK